VRTIIANSIQYAKYYILYCTSTGFLVESGGELFILAGEKQDFPFIGLDEPGTIDEETEESDSDDELDFGMM